MADTDQHITGVGFLESFIQRYPMPILETLLRDRSAGRNIIWADSEYEALGAGYMGDDEITIDKITGLASGVIKPRIAKAQEKQSQRTKSRAEVFTPSWLCNQMNNDIDAEWFGQRDVFNVETVDVDGLKSWTTTPESIEFPKTKNHGWRNYVNTARLEITCGEAPFVCSRYDTVTGESLPVQDRIGFLDRKLRVVSENTKTRATWTKWALNALKATYGYEYQGDNLLIARINVFETYMEHLKARWNEPVSTEDLEQVALIVSWNFWQMNGFTDAVPTNKMGVVAESPLGEQSALFEEPRSEPIQTSLFDFLNEPQPEIIEEEPPQATVSLCVLYDWKNGEPFEFVALKGKNPMGKKFYAVIGNPPYQEEVEGNGRQTPIYDRFMDESYKVADKVELITPARFLFDAGQTPKAWNAKMLSDEHLCIMDYEADGEKVFPGKKIKGGVVITFRCKDRKYEPIGVFTAFSELNSIVKKVLRVSPEDSFISEIVSSRGNYRTSSLFFKHYPKAKSKLGKGTGNMIASNFFEKLPECATETPSAGKLKFLCRINNKRVYRYIDERYVLQNEFTDTFNIAFSKSNGSGIFGETLALPEILGPKECATDTFISIGKFASKDEATNLVLYLRTKFMRAMLGVKKVTQDNPKNVWVYVPLQDFTSASDIDWSKSISEIDQQLYAKYGLDEAEIEFIETHVKEMS